MTTPFIPASAPRTAVRPTVLILGANGRFGGAAARAFDDAGWQVLAQVRRKLAPGSAPGARPVQVALSDTDALMDAARGAQAIVYAINPIYTRWDTEALPALQAGLGVAQRLGALFMLPGNVYNYGRALPALLTPETPFHPDTPKARIRVAMESLIEAQARRGALTACVVRAGDFFGAGRGSWLDLVVVRSLLAGKLVYPGPTDVIHAWAHLPDLARAFVDIAEQPAHAPFDRWHFEGHAVTGSQFLAAIESAAGELGLTPARGWRHGHLPWGLIRAGGVVWPMWRELSRMSYLWRAAHQLDGSRLAAIAARSRNATPLQTALHESLLALGFGPAASSHRG